MIDKYIIFDHTKSELEFADTIDDAIALAEYWDDKTYEYCQDELSGFIGIYKLYKELKIYEDDEAHAEYLKDMMRIGEEPIDSWTVGKKWINKENPNENITLSNASTKELLKELEIRLRRKV